ncbi:T9SS type A sorting domain-containing protein [Flavobacterium sp. RHBU_3]|uniref:T9SS type A sorting domain-containing protein n=1 Tax=Flavobacterium sp. RHBU_3 TaxID=3391184 RepID=UPI00398562B9
MNKISLTLSLALTWAALHAQAPEISWKKTYGGSGNDGLSAVENLPGGGHIIAGYTDSVDGDVTQPVVGMQDLWLLKTDDSGTILWQKTIGNVNSEMPNDIALTSDGGYIIAGSHNSPNSSYGYDFLIVKTDSEGNAEWQKILGGTGYDVAHGVHPTPDGGYIVAGESTSNDGDAVAGHGMSDFWVLKLDSEGNTTWQKKFGGTLNDICMAIQPTSDGGYVVAGVTESTNGDVTGNHGMNDYWLIKLNANGDKMWQKTYGGTSIDYGLVMTLASDGGYLLSGFVFSNDGDVTGNHGAADMWVVKTNATGTIEWQKSMGGTNNETTYDVITTQDGGYLLGGYAMSADGDLTVNQGNTDYWVVKLSSSGTLEWQKSMGGSNLDYVKGLRETANNEYIIVGNSRSGDGDVGGNLGNEDFWVVQLGEVVSGIDIPEKMNITAYPNPAADILFFSEPIQNIKVVTIDGKEVLTAQNTSKISTSHLPPGMYFTEITTGNNRQKMKFLKQ